MRLTLVTAAIATDFEHPEDAASVSVRTFSAAPQLGTLSLAAVLESCSLDPQIVNLDQLYYRYLAEFGSRGLQHFPAWIAPQLIATGAAIYGLGTICSSYPLTLRIAASLKALQPECTVLLGGPQASVVDLATLAAFSSVDFILRGESERTLPRFLEEWSGNRRFGDVPGLSYRSPFGPVRNPDAPVIDDLDSLPLPAYHLTGELTGASYAMLELGRGCPFACTFCSTNDFFRRKFRVKSPARMLADMRAIAQQYGIRRFELVHDMFTVDRRRVVDFCRHLIDSGEKFQWSSSARTDFVDDELLETMAAAGCTGVFFGIESGSARMQRIIDKDLDPDRARAMISAAERLGIATTVSLITGFPEENGDDLRETAGMYLYSLRHANSSPQLNLLAPLAGTPIHARHRAAMFLGDLCSDMSHQGRSQNQADRELIRRHPEIFPNFYSLPTPGLDRAFCLELREFLRSASVRLRWILVAAGAFDLFCKWRRHRLALHPELSGGELRHYYTQKLFADEFASFAGRGAGGALQALLTAYRKLRREETLDSELPRGRLPVRAPDLHVISLDFDIQAVIDSLKSAQTTPVRRVRRYYRTEPTPEGATRLIRISPLVFRALKLCDGRHTAPAAILKALHERGFIVMYRSASRAKASHPGAGSNSAYRSANVRASAQNQLSIQAQ
ncbi:MAG TPA: radical SAM protein [Bryobacteraceae bacterium]|nr:radical SAM protein [Bryobacteraceae bacterium]